MAPIELPLQPNTVGTKLHHPGLSSQELLTAAGLAASVYEDTLADFNQAKNDSIGLTQRTVGNAGVVSSDLWAWTPITADLDLPDDMLAGPTGEEILYRNTNYDGRGTPEAMVLRNPDTSEIAVAFRGTEEDGGDSSDWWTDARQERHYRAFDPLLTAIGAYLANHSETTRVWVVGHSLGGAMSEFFMHDHPDGFINVSAPNMTYDIEYEAVTFSSPQAMLEEDSRVLNIGHENDVVYGRLGSKWPGIVGGEDNRTDVGNTVSELIVLSNDTHNMDTVYAHSVQALLQSQFYEHATRISRVVINLATEDENDKAFFSDYWRNGDNMPAIILGRDKVMERADGEQLSEDDFLRGGHGNDYIEGFAGNDIIRGDGVRGLLDGGADTLAGGPGRDEFRGRPGHLNNDTIVDLEVGDRIALEFENLRQSDVSWTDDDIRIATDDGVFDWGEEITIFADVPTMATLVVGDSPDPALADGAGAYIHVVFDGPAVGERPEERVIDIADSQWNVRGHHPNGIITYTGTTLTITEQESAGEQIRVEGYFDWVQNIGGSAREIVEGYIDTGNDNYIRLEGKELQNVSEPDDTDEWDFFWQLGEYVGFVEDNGTDIVGYWNNVRDAWHAFRVEEPPDLALGLGDSVSVGSLLPETAADGSAVELWKVWDYDAASLSGYFFGKGYGEDGTFIDEGRFPGREQIRVASEHVEELEFGWVSEVGPKQFAAAPWEGEEWGSWEVFDVLVA